MEYEANVNQNKENAMQSDALRKQAHNLDIALMVYLLAAVIVGMCIVSDMLAADSSDYLTMILIAGAGGVYLSYMLVKAKIEYYKTHADLLDAISELKNSKNSANK